VARMHCAAWWLVCALPPAGIAAIAFATCHRPQLCRTRSSSHPVNSANVY